jgi:hypothetical protein
MGITVLASPLLDLWFGNPFVVGAMTIIFFSLDVTLTRRAYELASHKYSNHMKSPVFELNPSHQETVHQKKPMRPTTWVLMTILLLLTIFISIRFHEGDFVAIVFLGGFFWTYSFTILNHIQHILVSRYIIKYPESLKGELRVDLEFTYGTSKGGMLNIGILSLLIFLFLNEPFFLGGFLASILFYIMVSRWESKMLKQRLLKEEGPQVEISCPSCKKKLSAKSTYCVYCERPLEEVIICSSCNQKLPLHSKSCIYCGGKVK